MALRFQHSLRSFAWLRRAPPACVAAALKRTQASELAYEARHCVHSRLASVRTPSRSTQRNHMRDFDRRSQERRTLPDVAQQEQALSYADLCASTWAQQVAGHLCALPNACLFARMRDLDPA